MKTKNVLFVTFLAFTILTLTLLLPLTGAQQTTALSITPNSTQLSDAQVGSTIHLNLTITNVQNLFGWNLNLTWNPQILNLTGIAEGPFLNGAGETLFTWSPSSSPISRSQGYLQGVADVLLATSGVSGNGVLATLTFQVLHAGYSAVSIEGTTISKPPVNTAAQYISATITDGTVTIGSSSSITPTPTNTPTPTSTTSPSNSPPPATQTPTPTTPPTPTQPPVVPEFPTLTVLMFFVIIFSVALIVLKKKDAIHL